MGQAGWSACVIGAANGVAWMGVALVIALISVHLRRAAQPVNEAKLIASVVVIGGTWESIVVSLGLLAYPTSTQIYGLAPLWLLALWGLFAAQVNTTYTWLKPRIALASLLGAIAGPLSFHGGAALGALQFAKPWPASVTLACGWAVLLPLVIVLSRRWDGVRPVSTQG